MKITNPVTGIVKDIVESSDPVFSEKMLGNGILIKPESGKIYSPICGEIVMLYETFYAIGIRNDEEEILLHIGVDTVNLAGKYFKSFDRKGDKVTHNSVLVEFDFEEIVSSGYDEFVMLIIIKTTSTKSVQKYYGYLSYGQTVIEI